MKRLIFCSLSCLLAFEIGCGGSSQSTPPPAQPYCALLASPASYPQGGTSTLSWTSTYATTATIDNGIGTVSIEGSTTVHPTSTTTYTMTATGANGNSTSCKATVKVTMAVSPASAETYTLGTVQFTASAPATWSVDGGDVNGTIDANGKYTAPAIHPATSATVRATNQTDSTDVTPVSVKVLFGNGTLSWDFDPVFPSDVQNFFATVDPVQRAACGTPSDSATVKVLLDTGSVVDYFQYDKVSPTLTLNSTSVDRISGVIEHEKSHALQNSIFLQRFTNAELSEGFAETCRVLTQMRQQTVPGGSLHFMMVLDSAYRRFTPEQLYGAAYWNVATSLYALGQAALTIQSTAMAPANTTASDWPKYSLAPWVDGTLYPALNTKQAPLTRSELIATFDATKATIDGQSAGSWLSTLPFLIDVPTAKKGTTLSSFAYSPVNPTDFGVWLTTIDANGVHQESAPVTFHILDTTGKEVLTAPGTTMGLNNAPPELAALPNGAYTVVAEATFNGTTYTDRSVFANVPEAYATNFTTPPLTAPGMYFITVDANGNAVNAALQVSSGQLVWSAPGVTIVDANPANVIPATVTVNVTGGAAQTYTQPRPWTRVIPIQANQ